LTQRAAVVTGGAGGIGRATIEAFKAAGWFAISLDRIGGSPADLEASVDLAIEASIMAAAEALPDDIVVDALVNSAAISASGGVIDATLADWDATMAVNVRAAHLLTQLLHERMRGRRASIVNVASVHALATTEGSAAYAASKAALVGYTRAAAIELAPDGIRVNAVLPGAVDTPMLLTDAGSQREGLIESLAERTPLKRVGRPDEIAQAILFLADDDRSSFITGQTLVVDGGAMARLSTE
jgi:NAD(P)-dependent dehydrogenase (short-subunit alcohol dehydrogenase family)